MLEKLKQSLFMRGHRLLLRPYELNIVGVRSKNRIANSFDDTIYVFYLDGKANWRLHSYPATTDPGTHWLQQPINSNGTAILKPGQYVGAYEIGSHRGKYQALVQRKPVTVYRDNNLNSIVDTANCKQETGLFGINIHRASQYGTTKTVDSFSAGCQVFANAVDFSAFLQLCSIHRTKYGNSFTYTLIDDVFHQATTAAVAA